MQAHAKIPWIETPLIRSATLSETCGCNIYLKLDNIQPSGSFKSRGIGNFMLSKLTSLQSSGTPQADVHFYIASGGNAGLACVHASLTLKCKATIIVPETTSAYMITLLRRAGAVDVVQQGASWQEADDYLTQTALPESAARGEAAIHVPPFDSQEVWNGNATISHELDRQIKDVAQHYPVITDDAEGSGPGSSGGSVNTNVDAIVCSVGGGGLFSGIMQGLDELQMHKTRVIAVETKGADSLSQAVKKGELVTLPAITSIATSLGARTVCRKALENGLRDHVSTALVSDAEAIDACRQFVNDERLLVEPACGACPALCYTGRLKELLPDLKRHSNVVLIICGGSNMSLEIMDQLLAK